MISKRARTDLKAFTAEDNNDLRDRRDWLQTGHITGTNTSCEEQCESVGYLDEPEHTLWAT